MGLPLERIEKEIRDLDTAERNKLLRHMLAELEREPGEDVQALWLEESRRRYRELQEGTVETVSVEEALDKARKRLRNAR